MGKTGDSATHFVTIFSGSQPETTVRKCVLESLGFHPFLEHQFIKVLGPTATGGSIFELELRLPTAEAREAVDTLRELQEGAAAPSTAGDAGEAALELTESIDEYSELLGERIRWVTVICLYVLLPLFFNPYTNAFLIVLYAYLGLRYFQRVRAIDALPIGHGLNVACFVILVVGSVTGFFIGGGWKFYPFLFTGFSS